MRYPNFSEEKKLWGKGFKRIVGLDEAGRGPLAAPVVAAAVLIKPRVKIKDNSHLTLKEFGHLGINDSKKLSARKREELYEFLTRHPQVKWGTGKVSEKVIDRINILEATKLAMERAVRNLEKKLRKPIDFLILDGRGKINLNIAQKSVVKGDNKVFSCAAASIIAKVRRDRMMKRYDKKYPKYGFLKHKGYGTRFHCKMLKKYGPCKIHRKTFKPIKSC
jgi:ribonuclease HII